MMIIVNSNKNWNWIKKLTVTCSLGRPPVLNGIKYMMIANITTLKMNDRVVSNK